MVNRKAIKLDYKRTRKMNPIFKQVLKLRDGHYCHAIEVESIFDFESIIQGIVEGFIDDYNEASIIEFISALEVYYIGDNEEDEEELYNLDVSAYINNYFELV